ncbi:type II toxin-antitoxin system RelE/ParE family toxin [Brachyspira pilosicoli]|uniref:type II toxin-antitoxin system RelE/ParE family toxin n=1 Tax=Brachyspira pilosicoli TaxID=52584 RepID=UPI0030042E22
MPYLTILEKKVEDFLEEIKKTDKEFSSRLLSRIKELELEGLFLSNDKRCKHLKDGIWELKCRNKNNNCRILFFCAFDDYFILVDCFKKQKSKCSNKEIKYVKKYKNNFFINYKTKEDYEDYLKKLGIV